MQCKAGCGCLNLQRRYRNKTFYWGGLFLCLILLLFAATKNINQAEGAFNEQDIYAGVENNYTDNFFINILNNCIPALKTAYEGHKGVNIAGIDDFFVDNMASIPIKFFRDPLTIFKLTYSGFADVGEEGLIAAGSMKEKIPEIKSFSDAPEGAIYFSEEDEYTAKEKEAVEGTEIISNENSANTQEYDANIQSPERVELSAKSPQILIYHSHATESYMPNTDSNYHTLTEKYNVISMGNTMTKMLQDKYKYKVVHDKTYHDKESYAYSYANSLVTIKKQIGKYPSLKVILDIHRDAFTAKEDSVKTAKKNDYTVTINGKKAAKVMLVIGRKNLNYAELEKFSAYIKKKMDKLYPGLYLRTDRANTKYNQYFSNYSVLIEIGCMLNNVEEASYSAELMGNVIGEVLKELQE